MQPIAAASHESFKLDELSKADSYKLLASVIMPRPIAWITSRSADGGLNAAPFSFFNIVSSDPPLIAVSFSDAPDREGKDTPANIREHETFVVNLVSRELAEAMNTTATNAPRGTDETVLAGLTLSPSVIIDVPRIAASPVSLECRYYQAIEPGGTSTIILARILCLHILGEAFEDRNRLYIDPRKLDLIGRMHGSGGYCTTRDLFTIERKSWPLK